MQSQVAFFHQRRALAFKEIALMPVHTVKPYTGEIPDYRKSLKDALEAQMESLRANGDEYSARASRNWSFSPRTIFRKESSLFFPDSMHKIA